MPTAPPPRATTEVTPGVHVAVSRRDSTTSTVLVSGDHAVLVDPAWEPDELAGLAAWTAARGLTVRAGLATHAHHDHLLWHPAWGEVPRYASARSVELAVEHRAMLVEALGPEWPADLGGLVGRVEPLPVGFALPGGEPVEAVVHDAHAPGHTAYWLPARGVLLAGDMLSDRELPLPLDPDDLPAYLAGLDVLAPYVARAAVLVPGHGDPTDDSAARLAADRRYLAAVLAGRDPDDPRRGNPGMAQVHERVVALAADGRPGGAAP